MNQTMWDQQTFEKLQATIPENADYLTRLGLTNNNLLRMQEILRAEEHIPSWLDQLAYEPEDLTRLPSGWLVAKHLESRRFRLPTVWELPEIAEMVEYEQTQIDNEDSSWDDPQLALLEDPRYFPSTKTEMQILALPEVQESLLKWAANLASQYGQTDPAPTFAQALILCRLVMVLDEGPGVSPGLAGESIQSLLSEDWYLNAENPPLTN